MPEEPTKDFSILLYNLRVIFFNWLPAIGCLAGGVTGLMAGINECKSASVGGALYLLAGVVAFGVFGWIWRRPG